MRLLAAALTGAVISGVAMYAVGTRVSDPGFVEMPGLVQTVDTMSPARVAVRSAVPRVVPVRQTVTRPRRAVTVPDTVYEREPVADVVEAETPRTRGWQKSALIIGGAAASGAGIGGMVDGKKGALIGAAIGGGAASIYEASRRR